MSQPVRIVVTPTSPIFAGREWLASASPQHFRISDNTYHKASGWHIHPAELPSDVATELELVWARKREEYVYRVEPVNQIYSAPQEEPIQRTQTEQEVEEALSAQYVNSPITPNNIRSVDETGKIVSVDEWGTIRAEIRCDFVYSVSLTQTIYKEPEDYEFVSAEPE